MARNRKGNPIDGVLLVNKSTGQSSNRILQHYKRCLFAKKAGHTGALDPLATGLLPLCFGEATKFSQILLESNKTYETTARLGVRTDTCDADGNVISTANIPSISAEWVDSLLKEHFTGVINQVAPIYSALKVNGRPMYELARAGIEVEAKSRQVEILSIEAIDIRDEEIDLRVHCSKGTYIRSIVDELGQLLGCGAHVSRLHRIQHGPFTLNHCVVSDSSSQEALLAALLPTDAMILDWPRIDLEPAGVERFLHGNPSPYLNGDKISNKELRVYDPENNRFIGIGTINERQQIVPKRVISCDF